MCYIHSEKLKDIHRTVQITTNIEHVQEIQEKLQYKMSI